MNCCQCHRPLDTTDPGPICGTCRGPLTGTRGEPEPAPPGETVLVPSGPPGEASREPASIAETMGSGGAVGPAEAEAFGRYRLIRALGAGGMGVVYEAWDPELRRAVALKQIRAADADEDSVRRFAREAQLTGRLRHPGIVAVHDVGTIEGKRYLTMDYVRGSPWSSLLEAAPPPGDVAALRANVERLALVAEAVGFAHAQGILHRDLKPANVKIDESGRPRVMDFGLARETTKPADAGADPRLTHTGQVLGTPCYLSPEQAQGDLDRMGPATDVWALGVMLYHLITGQLPWIGASPWDVIHRVQTEPLEPPGRCNPSSPVDLQAVCVRALDRDPRRRYANGTDLADELRRWLAGEAVRVRLPGAPERLGRWLARHRRAAAAAGIVLAALLALAVAARHEATTRASRARAWLEQIAREVDAFEDQVARVETGEDARRHLAGQSLGQIHRILAADPHAGGARAWRGRVLELLGRTREAEEEFDRACVQAPADPVPWMLRGMYRLNRCFLSRGAPALMVTSAGATAVPDHDETAQEKAWREGGLADLAVLRERLDSEAGAGLAAAIGADRLRLGEAMALLVTGTAVDCVRAVEQLDGLSGPQAKKWRGYALYYLGRLAEAAGALDGAASEWPHDGLVRLFQAKAWIAYGQAERARGGQAAPALDRALQLLDRLLEREPANAGGYNDRGLTRLQRAELPSTMAPDAREERYRAIEDFGAALRLAPAMGPALLNRADARLDLANADMGGTSREHLRSEAIADATAAARFPDVRPMALVFLARAWMEAGRDAANDGRDDGGVALERAVAFAEEALAARPDLAPAAYQLGMARLLRAEFGPKSQGDPHAGPAEARAAFDRAIELAPAEVTAYVHRAETHLLDAQRASDAAAREIAWAAARADFDRVLGMRADHDGALAGRATVMLERAAAIGTEDAARGELLSAADIDVTVALSGAPANGHARMIRARIAATAIRLGLVRDDDAEARLERARNDLSEARSHGVARVTAEAVHAELVFARGGLRTNRAQVELQARRDARELADAAVQDLEEAVQMSATQDAARRLRPVAWGLASAAWAAQGQDPGTRIARARATADEAERLDDSGSAVALARGLAAFADALWNLRTGRDARRALAAAEELLRNAAHAGQPLTHFLLADLLLRAGRVEDSIAALEDLARAFPAWRAAVDEQVARLRAVRNDGRPAWLRLFGEGDRQILAEDYPAAATSYYAGLEALAAALAGFPAEARARERDRLCPRDQIVSVHYNLACVESVRSTGRSGPNAAPTPLDPAATGELRARALEHLEEAFRLGFSDRALLAQDATLDAIRGEPRFQALTRPGPDAPK